MRLGIALSLLLGACADGGDGGVTRVPSRGFFQPELVDFGPRPIGEASRADVRLTNSSAETLLFDQVLFEGGDGSAFAARTEDGGTLRGTQLAPSASLPISILFGPSEERPYATRMVVFSSELAIELEVIGRGRLVPPATPGFAPTAISFESPVEIGREVTKPLRLTNAGELPGTLARIDAPAPFSVTAPGGGAAAPSIVLMPGDGIDLEVRFAPEVEGSASASILFEMDGGGSASLPANGTGVRASILTCDATDLDFGSVLRGERASRAVSCQANGPYTLDAIEVVSGGASFAFEDVSPPLGSSSVTWSFDAVFVASGLAGERAGRIELVAAHGARTGIELAGEVAAPPPSATDLRVAMSWSAASTDFDLHLVRMGELPFDTDHDCHFAAKTIDWGTAGDPSDDPFLDRDDISGPGTEEANLVEARDGFYDAYVMYFGDGAFTGPAEIEVELNLEGGAPQIVTHSMSVCGNMWHVGTFDFRSMPATFTPGGTESTQWASRTEECR